MSGTYFDVLLYFLHHFFPAFPQRIDNFFSVFHRVDIIICVRVQQALEHPTHPARPSGGSRLLARRVHTHSVLSVLYERHAAGPLVLSCWRARR